MSQDSGKGLVFWVKKVLFFTQGTVFGMIHLIIIQLAILPSLLVKVHFNSHEEIGNDLHWRTAFKFVILSKIKLVQGKNKTLIRVVG